MGYMPLNRVLVAGCLLAVAACTSVRPIEPAQFIPAHSPTYAWVTYANGSVAVVAQPRIVGDTLMGSGVGTLQPVAIALRDIQAVRVKAPDHTRTILLATSLVVVAGVVTYYAVLGGSGASGLSICGDKDAERGATC